MFVFYNFLRHRTLQTLRHCELCILRISLFRNRFWGPLESCLGVIKYLTTMCLYPAVEWKYLRLKLPTLRRRTFSFRILRSTVSLIYWFVLYLFYITHCRVHKFKVRTLLEIVFEGWRGQHSSLRNNFFIISIMYINLLCVVKDATVIDYANKFHYTESSNSVLLHLNSTETVIIILCNYKGVGIN